MRFREKGESKILMEMARGEMVYTEVESYASFPLIRMGRLPNRKVRLPGEAGTRDPHLATLYGSLVEGGSMPLPSPGSQPEISQPDVLRISPLVYLRAMWSLLWTAFRHPLTTTWIDATTGKVIKP